MEIISGTSKVEAVGQATMGAMAGIIYPLEIISGTSKVEAVGQATMGATALTAGSLPHAVSRRMYDQFSKL